VLTIRKSNELSCEIWIPTKPKETQFGTSTIRYVVTSPVPHYHDAALRYAVTLQVCTRLYPKIRTHTILYMSLYLKFTNSMIIAFVFLFL
jgi:hypothetical protein